MGDLLVYGSYGYTGRLIVEEAIERGLEPVLAGRDTSKLEAQSAKWGLDCSAFGLDHSDIIEKRLSDVECVLNCAGPFVHTYEPMVEACLATGTHYLDITGEIEVFERIAARDEQAKETGVTLLPGVGFDVVPSDCLASHLGSALSDGTHLSLGFDSLGSPTVGTALSMVESLDEGGAVRENGRIKSVPQAWKTRSIDYGAGERTAVTIPWGDVSTAYRSTGVPNIEFYMALPPKAVSGMRLSRYFGPLLGAEPIKNGLRTLVEKTIEGPNEEERENSESRLWGEITNGEERFVARLKTPNGYTLTAKTAVESAQRTLDGETEPGYQTPSLAFGADYILEFDDVVRRDAMSPIQSRSYQ
jgi:short subunit dehydrogenase-like uncharacterized protein